jgi:DedD protein
MAFFKFRKGGDEHPTPAQAPESVEAMRKRARHRLIGAVILVLVGVIGFPLLFDNQPRPIAVDIPIEIPDKTKVKPLAAVAEAVPAEKAQPPAANAASAPVTVPAPAAAAAPSTPATRAVSGAVSGAVPSITKPEPKTEPKPEPKAETKVEPKVEPKAEAKAAAKVDDGAKARALLEGKDADKKTAVVPAAAASATGRFIVQVGAYADVLKAREARQKLEKAGLKTYTQVVQSPEGRRIRVRVGPFEGKTEADKVAEKIKKLDLPAAILEL